MVTLHEVERQLKAINCTFRFFGRPEVRELAKILREDEIISQAVNGFYEGGFAMLCVTNRRLLLIDRKPMFLTLEDLRFDMIAEVDFNHRLLNATVNIYSTNKSLMFTSWNHHKLRLLVENLQHHVMEIRSLGHNPAIKQQFKPAIPETHRLPQPSLRTRYLQPHLLRPKLARLALIGSAHDDVQLSLPVTAAPNPYANVPLTTNERRFPRW